MLNSERTKPEVRTGLQAGGWALLNVRQAVTTAKGRALR